MPRKQSPAPPAGSASVPSLESYTREQDAAKFKENQELARSARAMRGEVKELTEELQKTKRLLGLYEAIDSARLEPPVWEVPTRSAKHKGVPCLELTDIHWGAVVRAEEINGINAYNLKIAEQRLKRTFEGTIKLTRDYLAGIEYDGLQMFLPGDMHSGEIHAELRETNAETVADGIVSLLEPMEAGINMLAEEFGKVRVACVVGNHGRRTKKPIAKKRVRDNYDYLTYRLLERDYRKDPRVDISVSLAPDIPVQVYSTRYLLTHGDQFRGGSGISAELSPLLLGVHRKLRRDTAMGTPWDVMVMGHFHRTLMLPSNGLIVGGSVMGYDEHAFDSNFKPEPPQSAFWVTTPERGVTFMAPVHAMKRSEEGW